MPATYNGEPLAWTLRSLQPWECVACGQAQDSHRHRKDLEAILCGRCTLILADASPEPEDPLGPEERAAMDKKKRRRRARERRR